LIIQTPAGTFSSKKFVQSNRKVAASRMIRKDLPMDSPSEVDFKENLISDVVQLYPSYQRNCIIGINMEA
jgi:hypothetical protein